MTGDEKRPVSLASPSPQRQDTREDNIQLDFDGVDLSAPPGPPIPTREHYARSIAVFIVATFAIALVLLLVLGFGLLFWLHWAPDKANVMFHTAVIPYVEKIGTFATTVCGPLLAFILGYYSVRSLRAADLERSSFTSAVAHFRR